MPISPVLRRQTTYPFARLDDVARRRAAARDRRDRLRRRRPARGDARVHPRGARRRDRASCSSYPRAAGLPELREAIAAWIARRYGVEVDPATEIVPTLGSKEAIFSFAQVAVGERRVVAVPEPAYPVYERGALFAGARVRHRAAARGRPAGCPTSTRSRDELGRPALFWVYYPNNPTAATAPLAFYEELAAARRASTASSSAPTRRTRSCGSASRRCSALQVADRERRRRLQHALEALVDDRATARASSAGAAERSPTRCARSARRSAPRRRSSCSARRSRRGRTRSTSTRCASVYRRKRETLLPALEAAGFRVAGGDATFFLWLRPIDETVGGRRRAAARARDPRRARLVLRPGRRGLRPARARARPQAECERAVAVLEQVL